MAKIDEEVVIVDADIEQDASEYRGATDVATAIQGLNNPDAAFYSSIKSDSFAGKVKVAAALTNSAPIADALNSEIALVDFIVQSVQIADKDGTVNEAPRVTLVADDGSAYHGTSVGLLSSVRNIIAVIGEPDGWPEPLKVRIVEERGRSGFRYMTIKFA